jgi:hypothetical protein
LSLYACAQVDFESCVRCLTEHQRQGRKELLSQTSQNASQTGSQNLSQNDRKNIAKPDLRSPKLLPANKLIANASHKREEKKVEEKTREPTAEKAPTV